MEGGSEGETVRSRRGKIKYDNNNARPDDMVHVGGKGGVEPEEGDTLEMYNVCVG